MTALLLIIYILISFLGSLAFNFRLYFLTKDDKFLGASISGAIGIFFEVVAFVLVIQLGVSTDTWWLILIYALAASVLSVMTTLIVGHFNKKDRRKKFQKKYDSLHYFNEI